MNDSAKIGYVAGLIVSACISFSIRAGYAADVAIFMCVPIILAAVSKYVWSEK